MTTEQIYTVVNGAAAQALGTGAIAAVDTASFVSLGNSVLSSSVNTEAFLNTLAQRIGRTIISYREYKNKFRDMVLNDFEYGAILQKIKVAMPSAEEDESYGLTDGQSVDHYTIYKQQVQQVNFYGTAVYEQAYTIFKDQFDTAFGSMDEFVRFNAMNLTERNNEKTQYEENLARGLQANLIASLIDEDDQYRVVHVLTEYNTVTGQTTPLTATTVMQAGNFEAFIRWMYSKISNIVRLMGERSNMFQTIINSQNVLRHSSPDNIRVAMLSPFMDYINSMVLATTYHDSYMKLPTYEAISFWQSIQNPSTVSMTPVYTDSTGAVASSSAVAQSGVIGVIHDRDAIGYTITNPVSAVTPLNAKGLYWDEYYHARFKTVFDNTEKAVVLVLD